MWKSEGTVEYHERGIKFYHSCLFPLPERSRQTAVQRARDSEPRTLVIKGEIMPWDEQHQALVTQPPSEFSAFLSCTKMSFLWRKQRERQGHERCNNVGGQLLRVQSPDSWLLELQSLQNAREASGKVSGKPLTRILWAAELQTDLTYLLRSPAESEHCLVLQVMGQKALVPLEWTLALKKSPSAFFWLLQTPREGLCCCVYVLSLICSREESCNRVGSCLEILRKVDRQKSQHEG